MLMFSHWNSLIKLDYERRNNVLKFVRVMQQRTDATLLEKIYLLMVVKFSFILLKKI